MLWVDLVDNLFIAVWFALNSRQPNNGGFTYVHSESSTGWVHFVQTRSNGLPDLLKIDLRNEHYSLSLRPHAQHGISMSWTDTNHHSHESKDLGQYVVASVEIPNDNEFWELSGYMLNAGFLFPNTDDDHTYKILSDGRMAELISTTEAEFSLAGGSLGKIDRYLG